MDTARPCARSWRKTFRTQGKPREAPPPPSKWLFVGALVVIACVLSLGAYGHWRTNAAAEQIRA
jgi:cytochrome c-type biogenesis protein CcmH/NrfG